MAIEKELWISFLPVAIRLRFRPGRSSGRSEEGSERILNAELDDHLEGERRDGVELGPAFSQLLDHSWDGCGFRGNITQKPNLTVAFAVGDRHRDLKLRCVQANESYVLACHVFPR